MVVKKNVLQRLRADGHSITRSPLTGARWCRFSNLGLWGSMAGVEHGGCRGSMPVGWEVVQHMCRYTRVFFAGSNQATRVQGAYAEGPL
jgi:hypothetical protein